MKPTWPILLASQSPRRRELLERMGFQLTVFAPHVEETPLPGETAESLVLRLAWTKARSVPRQHSAFVLAADTTVSVAGQLLGKPSNEAECRQMLAQLSGKTHEVWTGVALLARGTSGVRAEVAAARTLVRFRCLAEREIEAYAASGEGLDKAGGYAIQGQAGRFVAELQGSLSNVIGLPLDLVAKLYSRLTGEPVPSPEPPLWFKAPPP